MTITTRVYSDTGKITVDTVGFNQYVVESGTLTSATRDVFNGQTMATGWWDNNAYGGPLRWWPDPYETGLNRNSSTPGGDSTGTNAINTWDIFRHTREHPVSTFEEPVQQTSRTRMGIWRTDGSIGGLVGQKTYFLAANGTVSLGGGVTGQSNNCQFHNKSDNSLLRFLPRAMLNYIYPDAYIDKTDIPISTTNVNVKPPNFFRQRTERYHSTRTHSSTLSLYDGTYPNRTLTSRNQSNAAAYTGYKIVVSKNNSTGHKVHSIRRDSDNVNITSSFTGTVMWNETLGTITNNVANAGSRAFKQMFLNGTCIYHAFTNNAAATNGSDDLPDWNNATWSFGSENPTSTKIHTGNACSAGGLHYIQYGGRFYTPTIKMGLGSGSHCGNTDQGYSTSITSNDSTPVTYAQMMGNVFPAVSLNSCMIGDSLYSYTGDEMYPDSDMRIFFKVNSGEHVTLGAGQYQSSAGDSGHGANNKNGTNQFCYGVHSTQTSVDYFVSGRCTQESLREDDFALEVFNEDADLLFTTRSDDKIAVLDGVNTTEGNWQTSTSSSVFTGVSTASYIHMPFHKALTRVYNTSDWPSGAVVNIQCQPWIYRSGTSIYIQWFPQRKRTGGGGQITVGVGANNLDDIASKSIIVMHGQLPA